jgi:hypothetical protein
MQIQVGLVGHTLFLRRYHKSPSLNAPCGLKAEVAPLERHVRFTLKTHKIKTARKCFSTELRV